VIPAAPQTKVEPIKLAEKKVVARAPLPSVVSKPVVGLEPVKAVESIAKTSAAPVSPVAVAPKPAEPAVIKPMAATPIASLKKPIEPKADTAEVGSQHVATGNEAVDTQQAKPVVTPVKTKKVKAEKGNMFTSLFGKKAADPAVKGKGAEKTSDSIIDTIVAKSEKKKDLKILRSLPSVHCRLFTHFSRLLLCSEHRRGECGAWLGGD
jgi:hypothetical protein